MKFPDFFVEVQGWYETPDNLCIAMEYFPHGTLQDCIEEVKEVDAGQILRQIIQGLCHMHAAEFVHRDLKPEVSGLCISLFPFHGHFADSVVLNPEYICRSQRKNLGGQDRRLRTDKVHRE